MNELEKFKKDLQLMLENEHGDRLYYNGVNDVYYIVKDNGSSTQKFFNKSKNLLMELLDVCFFGVGITFIDDDLRNLILFDYRNDISMRLQNSMLYLTDIWGGE